METFLVYNFLKLLMNFNLFLLILSIFILIILFYFSKMMNIQIFKNYSSFFKIKYWLLILMVMSFFFHIYSFWMYMNLFMEYNSYILLNDFLMFPIYSYIYSYNFNNFFFFNYLNFCFSLDFFGFMILSLAYIVGFYSLLAMDTSLYWKNIKFIYYFNIFLLIVFFFVSTSNILYFFLLYECLLLPSFFIVYIVSPSRSAIQASLYFLIWTQIGSLFVLMAIVYIMNISGSYDFFFLKNFNFTTYECLFIYFLLFFGFGFKVPMWPFHYWLTKTHVEAPAGFSMYLSGFLVKSAIFGFYKMSNLIGGEIDTMLFSTVALIGVIDASLKMWGQTDLKKLVAYGTIQEMNLIYLVFCYGDNYAMIGGMLFCFMHAILSSLMFFLVDCVQKSYHSRSVVEISGIMHFTPNLGMTMLFMCMFYAGLPGTLKFMSEFYMFNSFFEISIFSCFLLMFIANVFGLIGFSKNWFNVVFGMTNFSKMLPMDLTKKEMFILYGCFFYLFISVFFFNFFF